MRLPITRKIENVIVQKVCDNVVIPLIVEVATAIIIRDSGKENSKDTLEGNNNNKSEKICDLETMLNEYDLKFKK